MRNFISYGVALVIVIVIAVYMSTGTIISGGQGPGNGERPVIDVMEGEEPGPLRRFMASIGLISEDEPETDVAEVEAPVEEELQSVRIRSFTSELLPLSVSLRGSTEADAITSVRPETTGVVNQVHVKKGDKVAAGDLLCSLEEGTRRASVDQATAGVAQAEAALAQAEENFATNSALRERGISSANSARNFEVQLAAAKSNLEAARTALDSATTELKRTEIRSDVAGIIQSPVANRGDLLSPSGVCATVVQLDVVRFVGSVAESKIASLKVGLPAEVSTVTGQTVSGEVSYISASADSATRSFEVNIEIDNSNGVLRDGVTAEADIQIAQIPAHLLPQSVLTLDTNGTLGVRLVNDSVASFVPVNVLRDTTDGVWVAGLPTKADVIILGQEYVVDGQLVSASLEADNEEQNS